MTAPGTHWAAGRESRKANPTLQGGLLLASDPVLQVRQPCPPVPHQAEARAI